MNKDIPSEFLERWALFENAPVAACYVDPDGNFLDANEKWCELTGYSVGELKVMNFKNITLKSDLPGELDDLQDIAQTPNKRSLVKIKSYKRKDGQTVRFRLVGNSIEKDGKLVGFVSFGLPLEKYFYEKLKWQYGLLWGLLGFSIFRFIVLLLILL